MQDLDSEVQFLIQKARMLKAEKERAKRKAEAEEKKAEEERLKKEKKAKKKKAKEANATESEGDVPSTDSPGKHGNVIWSSLGSTLVSLARYNLQSLLFQRSCLSSCLGWCGQY